MPLVDVSETALGDWLRDVIRFETRRFPALSWTGTDDGRVWLVDVLMLRAGMDLDERLALHEQLAPKT